MRTAFACHGKGWFYRAGQVSITNRILISINEKIPSIPYSE